MQSRTSYLMNEWIMNKCLVEGLNLTSSDNSDITGNPIKNKEQHRQRMFYFRNIQFTAIKMSWLEYSFFSTISEVKLPNKPVCPSVSVGRSVVWLVCDNFLKGREVSLPRLLSEYLFIIVSARCRVWRWEVKYKNETKTTFGKARQIQCDLNHGELNIADLFFYPSFIVPPPHLLYCQSYLQFGAASSGF